MSIEHPTVASQVQHAGGIGIGFLIFLVLAVMTGVEYWIATEVAAKNLALIAIAFAKAVMITWYFMHVARAWLSSKGGHQ